MAESLKEHIQQQMIEAMRAKDKQRLGAIRLIMAAIKQKEVDDRIMLEDDHVLVILEKMRKQRKDSLTQYLEAGRQELADQESYEIELIQTFLPTPLTQEALTQLIDDAIKQTGAEGMRDMGKVMGQLKPKIQGRADMSDVSKFIKERLGG